MSQAHDEQKQGLASPSPPPEVLPTPEPSLRQVFDFLRYGLSLPERTLRASGAMLGGVIRETAGLMVPQAFQDSRSYRMFITQMLDFVAQDVGGVRHPANEASAPIENFVAKKAVSNFVELAGMATLHVSPLTLLAVLSDVAYGSKTFLQELSDELQRQGLVDSQSTIHNTADLLDAISRASGQTASAFDMPPLDIAGLRETVEKTRVALGEIDPTKIIPQEEIARIWKDMRDLAEQQHVDLFQIASAMTMYTLKGMGTGVQGALTTVRISHLLMDRHILGHYRTALQEIRQQGVYAVVKTASQPYLEAVWYNFQSTRPTITDDLVSGRLAGKAWEGLRGWFSPRAEPQG